MAIEIVDFPIKNGGSFHSYVKLPEGTSQPIIAEACKSSGCVPHWYPLQICMGENELAPLKWHISLFGYAPNLFTPQYSNPDMIPLNTDRP
jgi:hypothetical protein